MNFSSFPFFSLRFWTVCLILMDQTPNVLKKCPKIHFRCKISRSIECRQQNWPKCRGKVVKSDKPLYFWKIHNAKTSFLNWLKLCREMRNTCTFELKTFQKGIGELENSDSHVSAGFCDVPVYFYMVTQFWARIWIPH